MDLLVPWATACTRVHLFQIGYRNDRTVVESSHKKIERELIRTVTECIVQVFVDLRFDAEIKPPGTEIFLINFVSPTAITSSK